VNINDFFIGNAVPNIITDWALLILPLPYVWKIQRNTPQKIALCGAFAVGGLYVLSFLSLVSFSMLISTSICIISIFRLVVMLDSYKTPSVDVTWVFIGPSTWTAVETNIGIVSGKLTFFTCISVIILTKSQACLPSLGPFIRFMTRKGGRKDTNEDDTHKLSNWYASASSRSGDRSYHDNHTDRIDVTTSVDVETYRRNSDNMF
jgi:hypothetical protein